MPSLTEPLKAPWRITFDTNPDECNLRCIMCEMNSGKEPYEVGWRQERASARRMDVGIIRRVVSEVSPLGLKEIIPSTMGEPLLYQDFDEIIRLCSAHNIKMNLTTNGTWPVRGVDPWGNLLLPICSDIKISWNGMDPDIQESIMVGSDHERQLDDLITLLELRDELLLQTGHRCSITLQCTFMESNLEDLPDMVRFAISNGIDRVKGHHLWIQNPSMNEENMKRDAISIKRWNYTVQKCKRIAMAQSNDGSFILENFEPFSSTCSTISPAWTCPFPGREAWINHDGRFDPCCAPDALRKDLGNFGKVTENGLMHIWRSESYQKLCHEYSGNDLCNSCLMRKPEHNEGLVYDEAID